MGGKKMEHIWTLWTFWMSQILQPAHRVPGEMRGPHPAGTAVIQRCQISSSLTFQQRNVAATQPELLDSV